MSLPPRSPAIEIAHLHVRRYPDPVLRRKATPVAEINDEVRAVARRMIELMREEDGIGLAAPQVGLSWRLFVAHVPESEGRKVAADPPSATAQPTVYINPVLTAPLGPVELFEEGCLSLPEIRGDVPRPEIITIAAIDEHGQPFTARASGLLARCWQHEMDHLDGILILDRMVQKHRLRNRAAVRALEKNGAP